MRQLPRLAVPGDAAVDPRKPVRHQFDLHKPAHVQEVLQGRVGALLELWRAAAACGNGKDECSTGKSHMPTPTKVIWVGNSNSLLGNAKWSLRSVMNTLRQEAIFWANEWHWTGVVRVRGRGVPRRLVGRVQAART